MNLIRIGLILAVTLGAPSMTRSEEPQQEIEAWRSSPFHGQKDHGTGLPIPCTCKFQGRDFRVGERVCMNTPNNGVVLARCDLVNNVTSWIPTKSACPVS